MLGWLKLIKISLSGNNNRGLWHVHIVAKRNKATLEIAQKILIKFPMLGLEWTFDGNKPTSDMLFRIASYQGQEIDSMVLNGDMDVSKLKSILKMVVFHPDKSYTDYFPCSGQSSSEISPSNVLANSNIEKIVLFFDDNSFADFKPD
jgi:hypothetical protein